MRNVNYTYTTCDNYKRNVKEIEVQNWLQNCLCVVCFADDGRFSEDYLQLLNRFHPWLNLAADKFSLTISTTEMKFLLRITACRFVLYKKTIGRVVQAKYLALP